MRLFDRFIVAMSYGPPDTNKWSSSRSFYSSSQLATLGYVTVYRNAVKPVSEISNDPRVHMDSRVSFGLAIVTNLTLTGLTAGRIWWTRRQLDTLGQQKFSQRYTRAISVLMESGAAYSSIIILVILALSVGRTATTGPTAILASLSYGAAGQLVNIVPTVFIIRVCLGRNDNSGIDSHKPFLS
ncbi:hypothetical protein DFH09DRAFT_1144296 [Mycena vulgaris]|nr:hypothetical protein DFH09DRAFT_1144296 [Mycena vulgaris]